MWSLRFRAPAGGHAVLADALEDVAVAVSTFGPDASEFWQAEALFSEEAAARAARNHMRRLAASLGTALSDVRLDRLPARDWLAANRRDFPPVRAGRYFIRGSHVEGPSPPATVPIVLDASVAFGTGEHATTTGCLLAFDRLAGRHRIRRVLDLGTGSGILAIAAAKTLRVPIFAADIDHQSVRLARDNARRNGVAALVSVRPSVGFVGLPRGRRYDLIFANILARPLIVLAPAIARHLARGGVAILSGLLSRQRSAVIAAYRAQRLRLLRSIRIGDWLTVIVGRR